MYTVAILFILLFIIWYYYQTHNYQKNAITPKRHLIYICFKGQSYLQIAQLLISSIAHYVTRNDVDVYIRTDAETMPLVKGWLKENQKYLPNQNIRFKLHTSTLKMYQYRFEIDDNFDEYDKVLYLDTDILIANSHINDLFDENLNNDTVYVVHESQDFNRHEWSYTPYNNNEITSMMNHNVYPFNNGQFLFKYSDSMKTHFENVIKLTESKPYNPFIDQQSMNHYFNTRFLTNGRVLNKYTKLFATDDYLPRSKECIMHFSGNIHEGEWKLNVMLRFLNNNPLNWSSARKKNEFKVEWTTK